MNFFRENKMMSYLLLLLVVMNISTIGFCWILWNKMEHKQNFPIGINNPPGKQNVVEDELQLTPEQRKQFSESREKHFAARKVIDEKINENRNQLFDMIKNDKPDSLAMNKIAAQIGELETQKQLGIIKHFKELRAICTKEQKERFDHWIDDVGKLIGPQGPQPNPNGPPPPPRQGMDNRMPPPNDFQGPPPNPNQDGPQPPQGKRRRPLPPENNPQGPNNSQLR